MSITDKKTAWINSTIKQYCKETGDLPRSTSHMSTLEQWLMRRLWDVEKEKSGPPPMTIDEFVSFQFAAMEYWFKNQDQRIGQAHFNYLAKYFNPALGEKIRGTRLDPFQNSLVLPDMMKWLKGDIEL